MITDKTYKVQVAQLLQRDRASLTGDFKWVSRFEAKSISMDR